MEAELKYEVLNLLTTEGGKYTVDTIGQKIQQKQSGTRAEEYNFVINDLLSKGMVVVTKDKDKKVLWTAANCPHCPMTNEPIHIPRPDTKPEEVKPPKGKEVKPPKGKEVKPPKGKTECRDDVRFRDAAIIKADTPPIIIERCRLHRGNQEERNPA
jgi:hypothetical protein